MPNKEGLMDKQYFEAESAYIEAGAKIGAKTKIWHHSRVHAGAVIGRNCIIGSRVSVEGVVGDYCKVQNGVTVYSGVKIEDDVFVGPNATFTNDKNPRAFSPSWEESETLVKKGASIGANSTIRCGVVLGELSLVGSGAVVTKNVEPLECVVGNPAIHIGWVDLQGNIVSKDVIRPRYLDDVLENIDIQINNLRNSKI